jgi:hypothetical protein
MSNKVTTTSKDTEPLKRGQLFQDSNSEIFIVTMDDGSYWLTCLNDGLVYSDPQEDINLIFGCYREEFTRVYDATIVSN